MTADGEPEEKKTLHKRYHDLQHGFPIADNNELSYGLVL